MSGPGLNDIEVSVFGPGLGECIVVHVGSGIWIVVDSCINVADRKPVALSYLQSIGVDSAAVQLLVATHWHDDHIRGFSEIATQCQSASICISSIFTEQEFLAYIFANSNRSMSRVTSGVTEMRRLLETCRTQNRPITTASESKRILKIEGSKLSHGFPAEVWTLSPNSQSYQRFLASLTKLMPKAGEPKLRVPRISPNDCSVVVFIEIGAIGILLGADLEEGNGCCGWTAIVDSQTRPTTSAGFFKVPHHGSGNAHHPEVWRKMLTADPVYSVTPFNRSSKLPTKEDRNRLLSLAPRGYITANTGSAKTSRPAAVAKMVKDLNVSLVQAFPTVGQVRTRCADPVQAVFVNPELFHGASLLKA